MTRFWRGQTKKGRVLVTLDKDFAELAVAQERPHRGIVRMVNLATAEQVRLSALVLETHADDLSGQAIVTVERGRLRVRLP